jgi:formylglycine-generating enzyme required for sulfatase activity
MWCKELSVRISLIVVLFSYSLAVAACPSADLSGDCFVDHEDFTLLSAQWQNGYNYNDLTAMASQWLTTDPNLPDDMVYIPDGEFGMGDHFAPEGYDDELPLHAVLLDAFFMSKFEITNQQYCDYLNDANSLGLIEVRSGVVYASPGGTDPYCDTHSADGDSQIDHNDVSGVFSVRLKDSRDMSDDPVVEVSWYGAVAYCNWRSAEQGKETCYNLSTWECDFSKHGYRLATEAEWEYAARGGLSGKRFPWGDTISHSQANYYADPGYYTYDVSLTSGYHPNWEDERYPYTSVGGSLTPNGYGLYDMAGNVWEWCNDWYDGNYYDTNPYDNPQGPAASPYDFRVLRGGSWDDVAEGCRVAARGSNLPSNRSDYNGFRIVMDLE